jgi:2-hydroxy-6-oxonona-2,4-dienedioate hydrolase
MSYPIIEIDRFKYCEIGEGEPIVLLHGLFGALSNFNDLIDHFSPKYQSLYSLTSAFRFGVR